MNKIRELRKEKNLTLDELSKELQEKENFKISSNAIGKYERGLREPKLKTWQALANFFNVPVSYLQGTSENKKFSDADELLKTVKDKLKYVNDNLDTLVDDLKKDDDVDIKKIALELEKISEKMKKMQDNKKIFKN
ncbi:helix-turn-helix transcriptional regulator [Lactobacillus salivarius]|uniref:helix-turn-helix domain-containing protein n=2 Tax=Ligilactobacillus salivarius TaxID=1624 RepID=UPI0015C62499|nr:helix-turn-helix transcriptional regulator [Ligilactobacillus salivarius]NYA73850.1 helix-turn-helix transcriptional regulator [Ligilactobacillus salivarius]